MTLLRKVLAAHVYSSYKRGSEKRSQLKIYFDKVVANFRLGDRWEKNQLTWFLTKVVNIIIIISAHVITTITAIFI